MSGGLKVFSRVFNLFILCMFGIPTTATVHFTF